MCRSPRVLFLLTMLGALIAASPLADARKGGGSIGGGAPTIFIPPSGGGGGGFDGGGRGHGGGLDGGGRGHSGGGDSFVRHGGGSGDFQIRDGGGGDLYIRRGGGNIDNWHGRVGRGQFSTEEFTRRSVGDGRRKRQSLWIYEDGESGSRKYPRFDGKVRQSDISKRHRRDFDDDKHERHRKRHGKFRHFHDRWWWSYPWWLYDAYATSSTYDDAHVEWCLRRYRSYNIRTNTFVTYKGKIRECISPYV